MYRVIFLKEAVNQLKKFDKSTARIITKWLRQHLEGIDNPRRFGKPLEGRLKQFWRYRIGDYRVICSININDTEVIIFVFTVAHRKEVYQNAERLIEGLKQQVKLKFSNSSGKRQQTSPRS